MFRDSIHGSWYGRRPSFMGLWTVCILHERLVNYVDM